MLTSKAIAAFSFSKLQNLLAMLDTIEQAGGTIEDVREFVKAKREGMDKKNTVLKYAFLRHCECGKAMQFGPCNTSKRDQTGDDSTFVWTCQCGEQVFTNKPMRTIISESAKAQGLYGKEAIEKAAEKPDFIISKLSEKYATPKCPKCGEKTDLAIIGDKFTRWICGKCGMMSAIMNMPQSRVIEKMERGNIAEV